MNLQGCPPDSKSGASANFATSAYDNSLHHLPQKCNRLYRKRRLKAAFPSFSYCSSSALCTCSRAHTDGCSNPRRSRRSRRHACRSPSSRAGSNNSANRYSPARSSDRYGYSRSNRCVPARTRSPVQSNSAHCRYVPARIRSLGHSSFDRSRTATNKANT